MKRDATVDQLKDQFTGPDPDYCRRLYDEALGYTKFVQARLDKAIDMGMPKPDVYNSRANFCDLINEFAEANVELEKRYWKLLDAMEWDEDVARENGVTEHQIFMRGYKQITAEAMERDRAYWWEHDCVEGP